jgi:hypothetical protein
MNTTLFGGKLPMRATVLPLLAAVLFTAGCAVDATKFTCTSSAECPTGYHCDMGTATSAGTFKCASGAAQQKTLAADASKFLLAKRPSADGTVRTTISAGAGAVTSTPNFVGVRLVAKRGNSDVSESQVLADGSVLQVQVPEAAGQVSLRVQDDSGHSIPVTGYRQQIELSFLGKDVPGNVNPIAAYDASTVTDSLFDPGVWIPGLTEIPASSPVVKNIVSPAAYNGLASIDGVSASTTPPAQPSATGALGWEQLSSAATDTNAGFAPSARTGMAVAQLGISVAGDYYPFMAYGGADGTGAPADSTPTIHAFNPDGIGWTSVQTNTQTSSPGPFPSNYIPYGLATAGQLATISRAGTALAPGGSYNCTSGACNGINYNLNVVVAGGVKPDGTLTNNLFAYGSKTIGANIYLGWWDETAEGTNLGTPSPRLLAPNAGMASTVVFSIPVPSGTIQNFFQGAVMVGGQGIIPAGQPGANNDLANGGAACQYLTTFTFGSAAPTFQVSTCTNAQWATAAAAGQIGYRTGQALTSTDDTSADGVSVYMFGGTRANGPAGTSGLQNDLWRGTISVVCSVGPPATPPCTAAGAVAQTQITWSVVPTSGTKPTPRSGSAIAFNEFRKLTLYGGSDATGPLQDVWELDLTAPMPVGGFPWRKLTLDAAPALAPGARTRAVMLGQLGYLNNNATMLFGGAVGGTPTSDVWVLSRQSASRLLIAAPSGMGSPDTATNLSLTLRTFNPPYFGAPVYIWNGGNSRWDFVAYPLVGSSFATLPRPTAYLQPNGSFYFLMNTRNRSTPTYNSLANLVPVDALEVTLDFQ